MFLPPLVANALIFTFALGFALGVFVACKAIGWFAPPQPPQKVSVDGFLDLMAEEF